LSQLAAHGLDGLRMIDRSIAIRAAGLIMARQGGKAFENGRFSDAVLAYDNRDSAIEIHREFGIPKDRQAERVSRDIGNMT